MTPPVPASSRYPATAMVRLSPDVAERLHLITFAMGQSKQDFILAAITEKLAAYGEKGT